MNSRLLQMNDSFLVTRWKKNETQQPTTCLFSHLFLPVSQATRLASLPVCSWVVLKIKIHRDKKMGNWRQRDKKDGASFILRNRNISEIYYGKWKSHEITRTNGSKTKKLQFANNWVGSILKKLNTCKISHDLTMFSQRAENQPAVSPASLAGLVHFSCVIKIFTPYRK